MIRKLLTLAGRHGGRVTVVDYGNGLSIAACSPPIELVIGLDRDQVAELAELLEHWLASAPGEATVQPLNSHQWGRSGAHRGESQVRCVSDGP